MQEEIFGPILPIINVNSASEAIEFINARDKPLTLYLFSEDKKVQEKFMTNTSSGGMAVNECLLQMSVESLPFGGVGNSGMGAYHGKVSIFCKTILILHIYKYICNDDNSFVYFFRQALIRSLTTSPFSSEIWDSLGKRLEP